MELTPLSVMWQLGGRGVWRRVDAHVHMSESLCCSLEKIITMLIGYTPIQDLTNY